MTVQPLILGATDPSVQAAPETPLTASLTDAAQRRQETDSYGLHYADDGLLAYSATTDHDPVPAHKPRERERERERPGKRDQGAALMDGATQERRFMGVLRGFGFAPMRSPGSGTGPWDQPDVIAGRQGTVLAAEHKAGGPPANVEQDEVDALRRYADNLWAAAIISVRYKGDRTIYLCDPDAMSRTPSGHYSIPSHPETLPWRVALPYTLEVDDVDVAPQRDMGNDGVIFAADDPPPTLHDWVCALTTAQQGFQVRLGVLDGDQKLDQVEDDGTDD